MFYVLDFKQGMCECTWQCKVKLILIFCKQRELRWGTLVFLFRKSLLT